MTAGRHARGADARLPAGTRRLDAVQILRAVAAGMIVLLHAEALFAIQGEARGLAMPRFTTLPLGAGVDLFFIISGFIIVYASERLFGAAGGAAAFLRRRLLRVVPLYWFALSLRLAVLLAGAAAGQATAPGLADVATSYLFIPFDAHGFGPDYPFPILDLGWTLNYEMMFYVVFAGAMMLARKASAQAAPSDGTTTRETAALATVGALSVCVLAGWVRPPVLDQVRFWFRPIVLEFAAGIGLALLFRRGVRLGWVGGVVLCGLGIALWTTIDVGQFAVSDAPMQCGWARTLIWGGGAVLVFARLVFGAFRFDHALGRRVARLGDASYALYLLHPFVFLAAKAVLPRVPLTTALLWPLTLLLVAVSILATLAFHRFAEEPCLRWLQRHATSGTGRRAGVPARIDA